MARTSRLSRAISERKGTNTETSTPNLTRWPCHRFHRCVQKTYTSCKISDLFLVGSRPCLTDKLLLWRSKKDPVMDTASWQLLKLSTKIRLQTHLLLHDKDSAKSADTSPVPFTRSPVSLSTHMHTFLYARRLPLRQCFVTKRPSESQVRQPVSGLFLKNCVWQAVNPEKKERRTL